MGNGRAAARCNAQRARHFGRSQRRENVQRVSMWETLWTPPYYRTPLLLVCPFFKIPGDVPTRMMRCSSGALCLAAARPHLMIFVLLFSTPDGLQQMILAHIFWCVLQDEMRVGWSLIKVACQNAGWRLCCRRVCDAHSSAQPSGVLPC